MPMLIAAIIVMIHCFNVMVLPIRLYVL
jgi:hypothetical protein